MIDTYDQYGVISPENEDREVRLRRLCREDSALRPWLMGKALGSFRYTWWSRVKLLVRETLYAARWSWRLSK